MTRRPAHVIVTLACLAGITMAGCADAPSSVADGATDAIVKVREAYLAASRAGDVDAVVGLYVGDAVVMPPGRLAIEGQAALREYETAHHEAFAHPALDYESHELVVAGDWAFDRGIARLTEAPKDGSPSIDVVGKYLTVYRRQPSGTWKIARAIFNSSEDGVGVGSPFLLARPCM